MKDKIGVISNFLWKIKEKDREKILKALFTEKELEDLNERIEILKLLKQGKTQREIASILGISITTVTRGNKVYKQNKDLIDKYLN